MHCADLRSGAACWFAICGATDGSGNLQVLSWDRMTDCVHRGFTLHYNEDMNRWEVDAHRVA